MEQNIAYQSQENIARQCLGQPAHRLYADEVICQTCGAIAAGTSIGVNQVERLLGMGRSGYSYLALHTSSRQRVALKLFLADSSSRMWEAARREVRIITALRHPAILPIFSCTPWAPGMTQSSFDLSNSGQYAQQAYLLTQCQYVPGPFARFVEHCKKQETRQAIFNQGTTPAMALIEQISPLADALKAAHTKGVAHGAIVPGNVLFGNGRIWLADFGLGKLHPPMAPYLPPEFYPIVHAGQQADTLSSYWRAINPSSDQYMLAALCQQFLSQTLTAQEYEPLRHPLQRAMQQRPERRYPSIELFMNDLITVTKPGHRDSETDLIRYSGIRPRPQHPGTSPNQMQARQSGIQTKEKESLTPLPQNAGGPMTPALPNTPMTPVVPLTPEDWERRGDKLFTLRDYEEALVAYHRAAEANQGRSQTWLAIGDTYFALERHKEALMAYEQAMYVNPDDPQGWLNRGTALDALGRHREAVDCYEHAEQLR